MGNKQYKTALALEGGGMRGIYTAGVLDVLGENCVSFDVLAGVSAGAIHASAFLSGQFGRNVRIYLAYSRDPRFMGIRSWLKSGEFINYIFNYHSVPEMLVPFDFEAFEHSKSDCYFVATDVESGKPYYMQMPSLRGEYMEALRASASLPLVSKIVRYDGHQLLDGGTSDSIPLEFLRQKAERCAVVLTQVKGYVKKPEINGLFRWIYRQYPDYIQTTATRHERYNQTLELIEELENKGEIFVFRPSHKVKIKRLERDPAKILEMYELGRADAFNNLERLRAFMSQPPSSFGR